MNAVFAGGSYSLDVVVRGEHRYPIIRVIARR
jgi:hypothetical protein